MATLVWVCGGLEGLSHLDFFVRTFCIRTFFEAPTSIITFPIAQVVESAHLVKAVAVDVWQEVDVDSIEEPVDRQVVSFAALGEVASQPKHDLAAHGLRPEHAAEEGHVDLRPDNDFG